MFHHQEHHRNVKETYGEKSLFEKSLDIYLGAVRSTMIEERYGTVSFLKHLRIRVKISTIQSKVSKKEKKMKN